MNFLNIDEFLALCNDDAELALHCIDSHCIELDTPDLTPARRAYLDSHHYTDSTIDEIANLADPFPDDYSIP